jgi:hypothetical protein
VRGTILSGGRAQKNISDRDEKARGVRVRTIALPTEHGGWGLTLEPVVLCLLVAPSTAGLFLGLAALAAFLARHPLKIVAGDRRRHPGRRFPRTIVAERFALLYGGCAALCLAAALATAADKRFLLLLLLAAPLAVVQLVYDGLGRGRSLLPELAGSVAMASIAGAIALADGWVIYPALGLWVLLAARVVPTMLYVHARLKRLHGGRAGGAPTAFAHLGALGMVVALVWGQVVPALAVAAFLILLLRSLVGL